MKNPRKQNAERLPDGVDARPIESLPGYLVTADGRFWTTLIDGAPAIKTLSVRKSNTRKDDSNQRLRLRANRNGRVIMLDAATLACETWHGERPPGAVVGFLDGDKSNISSDNIGWRFPNTAISDVEFVKAWQSSHSVIEVAEKLGGVSSVLIYGRAKEMRGRGVKLKTFRVADQASVDELNAIIESE